MCMSGWNIIQWFISIMLPHLRSTLVKDGLIPAAEMYKYTWYIYIVHMNPTLDRSSALHHLSRDAKHSCIQLMYVSLVPRPFVGERPGYEARCMLVMWYQYCVFLALLSHQAGGHQLLRACQLLGQWWNTSTVALVSGLMCRECV